MSKKVVILGGIGNGSVIANAIVDANIRGSNEWMFAGYLNDRIGTDQTIEGYPVLGKLSDAGSFVKEDYYFINTIFRIDGQQERVELFENLGIPENRLATFVHPLSYIAPNVKFGFGSVVMPNVSISSGTVFGNGCLIMVGATIGHDNQIGRYCHFAAQSCIGAYTKISDGAHIGLNATTRENITIGKNATLGMGSVLTKSIGDNEIWVGNPAKFLRMAT
ncbi:MAG: NeuD/PglB/VioB family sugar acetyltransferase [Bacteroidetes bacterium]|nr:NeuD/PglB/VioB family sugar acetyltransferase [Bacteroidota bacterium]MBU1719956.1 NeuD/PglB/VioB family sugar acetyltransferase [Bacteroidota bacterium]